MNIKLNPVNFSIEAELTDYATKRAEKLYQMYDGTVGIEVTLKLENSTGDNTKTAELLWKVPGNDLFAGKTSKTFEEALDHASEALRKQLDKYKERNR
jgi:putative sigma-54 modulation protein